MIGNKVIKERSIGAVVGTIVLTLLFVGGAGAATQIDSCTTISAPGEYVLNQSIVNSSAYECIKITSSNVTFDGAGYTIDGVRWSSYRGVFVYNSTIPTNITLKNLKVTDWTLSILYSASNGSIANSTAHSNMYGIYLSSSSNVTLTNNTLYDNSYNFQVFGSRDSDFENNIDTSNKVEGKPVYYIKNAANTVYGSPTNAGVFYCIWCDNVTIKNIAPAKNYRGIYLWKTTNSTVRNVNADSNFNGIYLENSNNNKLINNTPSSNAVGISIYYSGNNTLKNNTMTDNRYNFELSGNKDSDFDNNIGTSNKADGKPVYYIKNAANTVYDSSTNAGVFYCIWCDNITIKDLTVARNYQGIYLWKTSNSTVKNVTANSNVGIYLHYSDNNKLINNTANWNRDGIFLDNSNNNNLSNNTANSNTYGISFEYSNNNTLSNNTANLNRVAGMRFVTSNYNNLIGNIVNHNYDHGLEFWNTQYNEIYNNNFNNTNNFILGVWPTNINFWNTTKKAGKNIVGGPNLGGNFWAHPNGSGFSLTCTDSGGDGICDSPFILNANNIDYLPLSLNFTIDNTPPSSITNLKNISYATTNINWTWTDPADADFSKVMVYLNGKFKTNVTKGKKYYNATGLIPNTSYKISTHTVDTSGNINKTWRNHTARTAPDGIAPRSVTNLTNRSYAPTYINWTWKDPSDADLSYVKVYIDGNFKTNVVKGKKFYNATGFLPNTSHKISTRTVDTSGNINSSWVNHSARTKKDSTKPASVTNLRNISYARNYINWTWTDPADADFKYVSVYIDGSYKTNVLKGKRFYNATGFLVNTSHKISTRTVDTSGNVNLTWVNRTARTAP